MKPLRVTRKPVPDEVREKAIQQALDFILGRIQPVKILLFGSAVTDKFSDQSDLDLLIVCGDEKNLRENQKALGPLFFERSFPIEIVWFTEKEFDRKKDLGGVAMIASHDGRVLYPPGAK